MALVATRPDIISEAAGSAPRRRTNGIVVREHEDAWHRMRRRQLFMTMWQARGEMSVHDDVASAAASLVGLWRKVVTYGGQPLECLLQRLAHLSPQFTSRLQKPPCGTPPSAPRPNTWPPAASLESLKADAMRIALTTQGAPQVAPPGATIANTLGMWPVICGKDGIHLPPHAKPEAGIDEVLQDEVMSVLQSNHRKSEKVRHIAAAGSTKFGAGEREHIVIDLLRICSRTKLNVPDPVVHLTVMLLDRYYGMAIRVVPMAELQQISVALLSISLKMIGAPLDLRGAPENLRDVIPEILNYLGQGAITCEDFFKLEVKVLEVLQFDVTTPTALEALDAIVIPFVRPGGKESSSQVWCLAKFMLEISLLHAPLHYQYPHAVLAAGAVYAALSCSNADTSRFGSLLQDAAEICQRWDV